MHPELCAAVVLTRHKCGWKLALPPPPPTQRKRHGIVLFKSKSIVSSLPSVWSQPVLFTRLCGSHHGPSIRAKSGKRRKTPPQACCYQRCLTVRPAQGYVLLPHPSQFCGCQISHTNTRAHMHPYAVHSTQNENKRLEFCVWHQTFFLTLASHSSFSVSFFHSSLPHRSVFFITKKKPWKNTSPSFSSS